MVPRFTDFYIPVLQVMKDVEPIEINKLIEDVASYVKLSDIDKKETTGSGNHLKYHSNISWAVTDLSQGSFIERVKRGYYVITIKGLELLEENPHYIDREYLAKRSDEFKDFLKRKGTRKKNSDESDSIQISEEKIAEDTKNSKTSSDLANQLEELYKAVQTLKKAKISTEELERKISEIEGDIVFNELSKSLIDILPNTLLSIKRNFSIGLDYFPGDAIKLSVGSKQRTFLIKSKKQRPSQKTEGQKSSTPTLVKTEKTIKPEKETIKKQSIPITESSEIKEEKKSSGVWIKSNSDRTFLIGGDTSSFEYLFLSYGGVKFKNTKGHEEWMFLRSKEEGLRKDLADYIIQKPDKIVLKSSHSDNTYEPNIKTEHKAEIVIEKEIPEDDIKRCIELFNKLRPFTFLGITGPHKAILLIAIFDGIRTGLYSDSKITFNQELESLYNAHWNKYVGGSPTLGAVYPFIHLGRESFFTHVLNKTIRDYDKTWSRHKIGQYVKYAILDKRTFETVKNKKAYERIKDFLINRYCLTKTEETSYIFSNTSDKVYSNSIQSHQQVSEESKVGLILATEKDLQDSFKDYLKDAENKRGSTFAKSTITLYLGALNSLYMINVVRQYNPTGNIYEIKDFATLIKIKDKVEKDYGNRVATNVCRSALLLYIRYISDSSF